MGSPSPLSEGAFPKARDQQKNWLTPACWGLFAIVVVTVLVRGLAEAPARHLDAMPLYVGGRALLLGRTPYDLEIFGQVWREVLHADRAPGAVFAYPPVFPLFLLPVGALPPKGGFFLLDAFGVLGLLISLFATYVLISRQRSFPKDSPWIPIGLLAASANGAISGTLTLGQSGLWIVAPVLAFWALPKNRSPYLAALCLLLSTFKPTLALPFLVYLLFVRPKPVLIAGLMSLPVVGVTMLFLGLDVPLQWLHALGDYAKVGPNTADALSSGHRVLWKIAPTISGNVLTLLGTLLAAALGFHQRKTAAEPHHDFFDLILLSALAVAAYPLHGYDFVIIIPMAAALVLVAPRHLLWFAPLTLILVRPALLGLIPVLGSQLRAETPTVAGVAGILLTLGLSTIAFSKSRAFFRVDSSEPESV